MTVTPQDVIERLSDWRGAAWSRLHGGMSNHTWLLDKDGRKAVLKIDDRPRGFPFNSREAEAVIQARAARAGLANRVLYADPTTYLTEYVEGAVWDSDWFSDPEKLGQLSKALRRLHALPGSGRAFDSGQAAAEYARRIDRSPSTRRRCVELIDGMPEPKRLCLCHNDLVAENILSAPGPRFLDWEYACDNDPLFDLATVVAHHGLSAAQREVLLDAYSDGDGSRWREQLERQEVVYESLLYLWERARRDRG